MALSQGQYGGQLAEGATNAGGTALLSNLASGAFGMLSGGGTVAIQAALEASKDTPTTQAPSSSQGSQSTGSKVFNLGPASNAMANNPYWQQVTGTGGSGMLLPILLLVGLGIAAFFILRRK